MFRATSTGTPFRHSRAESPLFECLNRIFIEAESEAADDAQNIDRAVAADDCFENDGSLIAGFARFFRILRFNAGYNGRRADAAADAEYAAAVTAAFARTDARSLAFADAAALTGSDAAADARSCGRRSGNAVADRRYSAD